MRFPVRSYGYSSRGGDHWLYLNRTPRHWDLLETVAEKLCTLSRHRFGCTWLTPIFDATDRRSEKFKIPASDETIAAFSQWMGWDPPYWMIDDDDDLD